MRNDIEVGRPRTSGLVEVLDRVLDKGLFIGGDVKISLAEVELLTIRIRLLVASVDKAQEMGIDWWRNDPMLSTKSKELADENRELRSRIEELESGSSSDGPGSGSSRSRSTRKQADG